MIKIDLKIEEIVRCLRDAYGLNVDKLSYLPLGGDLNTAVYRVATRNKGDYFLKLRCGEFNEASVMVPKYLADIGFKQVISPITTVTGGLWNQLASFNVVLYPYIDGSNGIEVNLSDQQWIEFGKTMKKFHSAAIPSVITRGVPRETFSSKWRKTLRTFLHRIECEFIEDPVAADMAFFLKSKSKEILKLIGHAENLAQFLQKQPFEYILCHADIHGWNVLVDKAGLLYVVDWDTLVFAPRERDLMFIGASIGETGRSPLEEEKLFYRGYGSKNVNTHAIAYYRFERVIEDIGVYGEQIFFSSEHEEDRMQSFENLKSNFLPNGTIERAYQSYKPV